MQKRTVKILIALFIVASLVLVLAPPAMSKGMNAQGWKGKGERLKNIDEIYESVALVGTKDGVTTLNILGAAIKDKGGNVTVINFPKPVAVQYYSSNKTFTVARQNKSDWKGVKPTRTTYDKATISPAGASGIVALKNVNIQKRDNTTIEMKFSGMSVYLPDKTVKQYALTAPATLTKSLRDRASTIDNPAVIADMQDAFKGGAKFSTITMPVSLKAVDGK